MIVRVVCVSGINQIIQKDTTKRNYKNKIYTNSNDEFIKHSTKDDDNNILEDEQKKKQSNTIINLFRNHWSQKWENEYYERLIEYKDYQKRMIHLRKHLSVLKVSVQKAK